MSEQASEQASKRSELKGMKESSEAVTFVRSNPVPMHFAFLDASTHLYKRVCPAVGPSVHHAIFKNPQKRLSSVADDIRMNGGTSRDPFYTHIHAYKHTRTHVHAHAPMRADEINKISEFRRRAIAKHRTTHASTYTHTHTHTHTHIKKV